MATINSFLFSIVVGICFFVCNVQSQQVFEICNRGCEYATISEFLDDANVATSDIPAMSIVRICGGGNFYGDARLITRPFIWESRDYCADFTASSKTSSSSSDSSSDSISDSTSESSDSTLDARPHFTSFDDSDRDDFKPVAPDTESTGPFPTRKRGRKAMKQGSSKSSKSSSSSSSSSSDSSSPFNMKPNNNGSPAKSMANMKKQKQSPKIKEKGMKKLKNEQQEKHQHHQILKDQHANGDEIFIEEHQVLKDDSRIVVEKRQASITGKRSMKRRLFPKPASPSTSSSAGNSKSGSKSKSMSKPKFPISSRVRLLPIAGTFLYGAGNLDAGSRVVFNLGAGSDGSEFRGNHFSCDATIVTISIAIYISAAGGNVIERNYFESCYNGVFAAGSSYNNIRDNEFFVKPGNQTTTLFASSGVTINTNAATAVSLLPSQFNMIENNQFDLKGVLETMWRNLATSKVVSSTYHGCFVTAVDIYADKGLASAVVQPPNRYNTVQRNLVRSLGAPFAAVYIHSQADSPSPASPAGLTPFPNCDFLANNNRVLNNDITGVPIIIDQADANTIRENSIKNIRPLDPLERYYYAGAIAIYAGDGNCIKSNEMMGRGNAAVAPTAGIVIGENDPIYPKYAMPAGPYTCPSRRTVIEDNSVQGLCGLEMLQVEVQYTYTFRGNVINTCAYVTPFGAVNSPLPATRTCTPFPNAAICPELSLPVPNWPLATACSVDIAF